MTTSIVYIRLGTINDQFVARYLPHSLTVARRYNPDTRMILVMDRANPMYTSISGHAGVELVATESLQMTDSHREFSKLSPFDEGFRHGFWRYTTERFFVLERLTQELGLSGFFQSETDNLIFFNAPILASKLTNFYPGIAGTFDNDFRCVPGLMFINAPSALEHFNKFILQQLSLPEDQRPYNDMELLGQFRLTGPQGAIDALPVMTPDYPKPLVTATGLAATDNSLYIRNFEKIQGVFDANAIGQYLYGVDPRNDGRRDTRGFINEACVFRPSYYRYAVRQDPQRGRIPYICSPIGSWPLFNIHMHNKGVLAEI